VAAELADADGRVHRIVEKVPVLTTEDIDEHSTYPIPLTVPCNVLRRWTDDEGRNLVHISLAEPRWGLETVDGKSDFVVLESQLSETDGATNV
jgi:hypothetical protein